MRNVALLSVVVVLFLVITYPLAMWTDSNLDFWFTYFKDAPVDIPFGWSYAATLLLPPIAITGNLIMSLARFAV